jgi:hypothetical protein|nr:MAG TPA: hypothetical protein [Caudoviricetes sp.]
MIELVRLIAFILPTFVAMLVLISIYALLLPSFFRTRRADAMILPDFLTVNLSYAFDDEFVETVIIANVVFAGRSIENRTI